VKSECKTLKSIPLDKDWSLRLVQTIPKKEIFIDIRKFTDKCIATKGAWVPVTLYHSLIQNLLSFTHFFEENKIVV
jgi:hypothetical protein